jgi:predicted ferric reductase
MAAFAALAVLVTVCAIPWYYPSSTLLYKFGSDKSLLLIGKSVGLAAGVLLLIQVTLAARWRRLERMISQNRLIGLHRWVGYSLVAAATLHPLLVFAPEDVSTIPPSLEFWPEMIGATLLVGLLLTATLTMAREFLEVPHPLWKLFHRLSAMALATLFLVHVLFVSDSYASGLPRYVIIGLVGAIGLTWLRIAVRRLRRCHPHRVTAVLPAGKDAVTLELRPVDGRPLAQWPGQFAYLRFHRATLPAEEHPFTIASAPGRPEGLSVTVRCAGDWTRSVGQVRPGDMVHVEGPYGRFTPEAYGQSDHLVLIAGGVGITPMLSILRSLAEKGDRRRLTLIWSNRTRSDVLHANEMQQMAQRLPGLDMSYIFTREKPDDPEYGRLDRARIRHLIGPSQPGMLILLCGPAGFMRQVRADLKSLGYPGRSIKTEAFRM